MTLAVSHGSPRRSPRDRRAPRRHDQAVIRSQARPRGPILPSPRGRSRLAGCGGTRLYCETIRRRPPKGDPIAALSPAQADEASLWLVIVLAVLLAVSLAAVIMSPSPPGGRHAKEGGAEPGFPGSGHEPPASAL